MGDRLFRVGNLKKAEERYQQAARLDSDSASARVRLAAPLRERYTKGPLTGFVRPRPLTRLDRDRSRHPGHLRRAQHGFRAPPGPARVSSSDPHPDDRDASLVLGAQFYISAGPDAPPTFSLERPGAGRTRRWRRSGRDRSARGEMSKLARYYAAACQTDLPCPRDRDEIASRVELPARDGGSRRRRDTSRSSTSGSSSSPNSPTRPRSTRPSRSWATGSPSRSRTSTPTATREGEGAGGLHPDRDVPGNGSRNGRAWSSTRPA